MARTLASILLPPVLLIAGYAVVPADPSRSGIVILGLGLAVFVVVLVWLFRRVERAERPIIVALSAIALFVPLLLVLFGYLYAAMSQHDPSHFNEPLGRLDSFYFATSTFATVGYGDIHALSGAARLTVTLQILLDLIVLGGLVKLFTAVARRRVDERDGAAG